MGTRREREETRLESLAAIHDGHRGRALLAQSLPGWCVLVGRVDPTHDRLTVSTLCVGATRTSKKTS